MTAAEENLLYVVPGNSVREMEGWEKPFDDSRPNLGLEQIQEEGSNARACAGPLSSVTSWQDIALDSPLGGRYSREPHLLQWSPAFLDQ